MALDLYLVRHGETLWSRTGQHTGRTDLPLLPEGEEQAHRLGEVLRHVNLVASYSSDLQRALRTAQLAGVERPQVTPLLREYDYGEYEGLTSEQIWKSRPAWQLYADGCPGGETPDQVYDRARRFLAGIPERDAAVAVFSHGHFLRAAGAAWADLGIGAAARLALDTASISVLHDGDRGRVIQRWNWEAAP